MLASPWVMVSAEDVRISDAIGDANAIVVKPVSDGDGMRLGYAYLEAGKYRLALLEFKHELDAGAGGDSARQAEIHSAAGYALYLLQRPEQAETELKLALDLATKIHDLGLEARARGYLGLVYAASEAKKNKAVDEFGRSQALARTSGDWPLVYASRLQLARLETGSAERLHKLREIASDLQSTQMEDKARVNLLLNIIDQLKHLQVNEPSNPQGVAVRQLGYSVAETADALAAKSNLPRAQAQIEGYLAGLYEQDGKTADAISMNGLAIRHANAVAAADLLMTLQATRGRLLARQGQEAQAIEAYRLAVYHVGEVRNDIPLVYQDGKSSYSETLEPIYRGLADLLLRSASRTKQQDDAQGLLLEAIHALEGLKQSELEDYLNDRCALDTQSGLGGSSQAVANLFLRSTPSGELAKYGALTATLSRATGRTAILYPIIFDDRLELLLVNNGVIRQKTVNVSKEKVTQHAMALNTILRRGKDYWIPSRQLYQWFVSPLEGDLHKAEINRIVYIPDGILRLAPLAAFNNGKTFVAEHYEVVTNSVLQTTLAQTAKEHIGNVFLAGLSVPDGPSLDDIPRSLLDAYSVEDNNTSKRSAPGGESKGSSSPKPEGRWATPELRAKTVERLSLPGVTEEIHSIEQELPNDNDALLNQTFTSQNLEKGIQSGDHQLVHISSHGYFGHSAKDSFIMTYDKNLGVAEVERIMRINQEQGQPVDLVTFSACETAQGDDRAPLGFTGLAIKASARNAMGALWPISDNATKYFMKEYYLALSNTGGDTGKSLHLAQTAMLREKSLAHPSYWAAFILVGAW